MHDLHTAHVLHRTCDLKKTIQFVNLFSHEPFVLWKGIQSTSVHECANISSDYRWSCICRATRMMLGLLKNSLSNEVELVGAYADRFQYVGVLATGSSNFRLPWIRERISPFWRQKHLLHKRIGVKELLTRDFDRHSFFPVQFSKEDLTEASTVQSSTLLDQLRFVFPFGHKFTLLRGKRQRNVRSVAPIWLQNLTFETAEFHNKLLSKWLHSYLHSFRSTAQVSRMFVSRISF